jgi:hypothetical protein
MEGSSSETSATVGSKGGSSSEASAIVKSDRVAMLMDGDGVTGDPGTVSGSGVVVDSGGGGWGI